MADNVDDKVTIVVCSGEYDKALAAFLFATIAASMGKEVIMFFTFWGLNVVKKPKGFPRTGPIFKRIFNLINRDNVNHLPLSRFNFMGLGRLIINLRMRKSKVANLQQLIEMARELGVKLLACTMAMDLMGLTPEDMIEGVDEYAGASTYFDIAFDSRVNLFI